MLRGVPVADKPLLEHSLRLALMHLAEAAAAARTPLMTYCHGGAAAASVPRLLDLALFFSQHRQTDYPGALLTSTLKMGSQVPCGSFFLWYCMHC